MFDGGTGHFVGFVMDWLHYIFYRCSLSLSLSQRERERERERERARERDVLDFTINSITHMFLVYANTTIYQIIDMSV